MESGLKGAGMQSVHTLLKLSWTGHVTRMPDEGLTKKVFYGELRVGKRSQGGQKKRYKFPERTSTYHQSWEQTALDRAKWP